MVAEYDGLTELQPLESRIEVEGGLGTAQYKETTGLEHGAHMSQHFALGLHVEVDEDVAQEDDLAGRNPDRGQRQVAQLETGQRPYLRLDQPLPAALLEVRHEVGRPQAAIDLELGVA